MVSPTVSGHCTRNRFGALRVCWKDNFLSYGNSRSNRCIVGDLSNYLGRWLYSTVAEELRANKLVTPELAEARFVI
jgi:hypothetical protein